MRSLGSGHSQLRRGLRGALLAGSGVLAVACSTAAPSQTFHPASHDSTPASAPTPTAAASPLSIVMPPFGHNAQVRMTAYRAVGRAEQAAVVTAQDFVLAVLYADYTGDRDDRWRGYVSSASVRSGVNQTLHVPSVTTESFTGTVRFWRMNASHGSHGTIVVTECVDTAGARNTSLSTGHVLPRSQQNTLDQNYYLNSDVLKRDSSGHWGVTSIPPTIYYPRAQECKP